MQTWYYSANGERQGPVSYEELKSLSRSGRLHPDTDLAWTEGMSDWKPSGQISGLFQDATNELLTVYNPYAVPSTPSENLLAPVTGGEIPPGSFQLDASGVIGRCIELTKRHFWVLVGIGLVYLIVTSVSEGFFSAAKNMFIRDALTANPVDPTNFVAVMQTAFQPAALAISLVAWVVSTFFTMGLTKASLNVVSGKDITVGTLFSQGDKLPRVLGASFLYYLMVSVGFILLIFPGIYLALRFMNYQNAIIDKNMGVMDSLRYSSDLTKNNRMNLFVLALLSFLVCLAGALALLIGLAFALPVVTLAFALAYRVLQYGHQAMLDEPGTKRPQLLALCGDR